MNRQYYKDIRRHLYKKDKECFWCGIGLCLDHTQPNYATIEHVVPKSKGGSGRIENLRLACQKCNSSHINEMVLC